jgi:NADP-reducing hydrogenase subunit HndB
MPHHGGGAVKIRNREAFRARIEKIRDERRARAGVTRLLLGYGTCGIAAGATEIHAVLERAIASGDLRNVELVKVGCVGFFHAEPTIEIVFPDGSSVLLGYLHANTVPEVIFGYVTTGKRKGKHVLDKNWD